MADKTMLNFKYGIFDRLPETQVPGTVYVTADEKAMYVDLPAVTGQDGSTIAADRIRISQIVVKNSSRDAQPPFSTDAFYYFVEENALLKWDGEKWTQLNNTAQLTADISTLKADVATLKGDRNDIQAAIALLNNNAETQGSVAYAVAQAVAIARAAEKANADAIDVVEGNVTTNTANIKTNTDNIANLDGDLDDAKAAIDLLNGNAETEGSVAHAVATEKIRAEGIETNLQNQINNIVNGADGVSLSSLKAAVDGAIAVNTTQSTSIGTLEGKVEDLEASSATKTELSDQRTALENYINTQLANADAMTFKGGIASYSTLPKTGVKGGDTYVLTANDNTYTAGDMLIANADQGEETEYAGGWTHVKTGYIESHNDAFVVTDNVDGAELALEHYAGADSVVTFKGAEGSNVIVDGVVNPDTGAQSIMIGMEWGSF